METDVFNWVGENNALYIITGVAYEDRRDARRDAESQNQAYPDFYWKVLCDAANNQSVGFLQENRDGGLLVSFITVDEIAKVFGADIVPAQKCRPDRVDQEYWGWSTESYERGAKLPFSVFGQASRDTLRKLYHQHRDDFARSR